MIYEIRTYDLKPGTVAEFEQIFGKACRVRTAYSPLIGCWHTDIGPLDQVVHIWGYESLQQRAGIRVLAQRDPSGLWPPAAAHLVTGRASDIIVPVPNMAEWNGPQEWGNLYELRMCTYPSGVLAKVAQQFGAALAARHAVYPVAGVWISELGNLNRLYQLFPYRDWAHRDTTRSEVRAKGVWPPPGDDHPVDQMVRHMVPAPFSPLH